MKNALSDSVEIIRYTIAADQQLAFEQDYAQAASHLQASPYCRSYQILHGVEEAANYIVIIHWTSMDEHLNGFRKSEEFGLFFRLVKPFFTSIQEMKHYTRLTGDWTKPDPA
ncbi:antibiotic biosynthesis monooxygenase [Spirosoma sp. KNUC1025]|uniref:antibiotic biosynthesis monooxygenase family protein n=1 Tax=Spirosoma sp. KNUC1025 TaxID=2894082 RepID=UPI001E41861F|nr:antibiotic biosynthesis monooxygenase family protein [Spirosoma sp. KNUC1025]UFH57878.1 antibiotic biosynthesis monooxygenase [Spirosoma sp. KNUC1025]